MNNSTKFQLHPSMASEEKNFEYCLLLLQIKPSVCHGSQSNLAVWTRSIWLVENLIKIA